MTKLWGAGVYLQENKSGFGMGIMFAAVHGELTAAVLNRKMTQTTLFKSWAGQLTAVPPALLAALRRVVRQLSWHGGGEVEFCQALDGTMYIVDFNPRFPANVFGACHAGVNLPGALVQHLMHMRPEYARACLAAASATACNEAASTPTVPFPSDDARAGVSDHYYGRTVLEVAWQRTQPILTALPGKTAFTANIKGHPSRIFDMHGLRTSLERALEDTRRAHTALACSTEEDNDPEESSSHSYASGASSETGLDSMLPFSSRVRSRSVSGSSNDSDLAAVATPCRHAPTEHMPAAKDNVEMTTTDIPVAALTEDERRYYSATPGADLGSCSIRWEMGTFTSQTISSVPRSCLEPMVSQQSDSSSASDTVSTCALTLANSSTTATHTGCEMNTSNTATLTDLVSAEVITAPACVSAFRIADPALLRRELAHLLPLPATLEALAAATPRFLISRTSVRALLQAAQHTVQTAAQRAGIAHTFTCLSIKTQPHHVVLEEALALGYLPEAISSAEARTALRAGFTLEQLVFNGPCKWFDLLAAVHNDNDCRQRTTRHWAVNPAAALAECNKPLTAWQAVELHAAGCGEPAAVLSHAEDARPASTLMAVSPTTSANRGDDVTANVPAAECGIIDDTRLTRPALPAVGAETASVAEAPRQQRVKMIFADSVAELAQLVDMLESASHWLQADVVGLRLTPTSVAFSRFGAQASDPGVLAAAALQLRRLPATVHIGLHFHFASSTVGLQRWQALAMAFIRSASTLSALADRDIHLLDFGGGWASHLLDDPAAGDVLAAVFTAAREALPTLHTVALEPGKCTSERAGALLTRVHHVREFGAHRMAVVDASVAELGALASHPHPLLHLRNGQWRVLPAGADAVGGRTCMEWDYAHTAVQLPDDIKEGDYMLVAFTGACEWAVEGAVVTDNKYCVERELGCAITFISMD